MSSLHLPHSATSAALARHRMTADLAAQVSGDVLDDAALVLSELVGNAVRHGVALPGGGLLARWDLRGTALRLEVSDGGAGPRPRVPARPDAESGRGLDLVGVLAARWGSCPVTGGTTVWAELPAPRPLPVVLPAP